MTNPHTIGETNAPHRPHGPMFWSFLVLMGGLFVVFVLLGNWQVARLAEKDALVATVADRLGDPPSAPPAPADWPALAGEDIAFRPMTVIGGWVDAEPLWIFTSIPLGEGQGAASGPGYWMVQAFAPEAGGTIFVNRGFVPDVVRDAVAPASGSATLTGLAREPEPAGPFTPAADTATRIDWVRDPVRLAAYFTGLPEPVAPFTLDLEAGPAGALPQGGETVVDFPNNHLGYAITWYGFAAITPFLLGAWVWRQRRRPTDPVAARGASD